MDKNQDLDILKGILISYIEDDIEKTEYLIYHFLENNPIEGNILLSNFIANTNNDYNTSKKIIYKQILKFKKEIDLRIQLIKILIKNKEYTKALKWCERSIPLANNEQRVELYFHLSNIFYILNRVERSLQYLNLCLKINKDYIPAKTLLFLIENNLKYEHY